MSTSHLTSTAGAGVDDDSVSRATSDGTFADGLFSDPLLPGPVMTMKVLVVEDDPTMARLLVRAFEQEGYAVDVAGNGQDALACGLESDYDVILLDAMIPPPDGFSVLRELRRAGRWAPVLMLTSRDGIADLVTGLDAGADDYVTKPFSLPELRARVYALSRRAKIPRARPLVPEAGEFSWRHP